MAKNIVDLFEDKARAGDGQFAVAFALMQISQSQERLATYVGRLGFKSSEHPGAFEFIGMQMERVADALQTLNVSATVDGTISSGVS